MDYKIRVNQLTLTVQRREFFKYGSEEKLNDILRIGGRDACVEFKYMDGTNPPFSNPPNSRVELLWLHTSGQRCNDENIDIRGTKTMELLHTSVQILKTYLPTAAYLDFLDNSHYPCIVSGKSVKIFLNHYYFVFHNGKTWYDAKFGAYPTDAKQREQYNSFVDNFHNPKMKPDAFDFMTDHLNTLFQPIWAMTNTWGEFISEIRDLPDICQKAYPWYYRASNCIRVNMPMPEQWTIDIGDIPALETPPPAIFERKTNGGRRKTRKQRKKYEYDISICPDYANPTER